MDRKYKIPFICLMFVSLFFFSCKTNHKSYNEAYSECKGEKSLEITCLIGAKAPNFNGLTIDNKKIELDELSGNVIVLNFWFKECQPCIAEMPGLNDLVDKYKSEPVAFISIARESVESIKNEFLPKNNFAFEIIPDASSAIIKDVFKNNWGFPLTIVIDKEGVIQKMVSGGRVDSEASAHIKRILIPEIDKLL